MTKIINKKIRRKIRKRRSKLIKGVPEMLRVVLSESNRYLRVQAVDDTIGHTLLSFSTQDFTETEIKKVEEKTKEANGVWKLNSQNYSRKNEIYAGILGEIFAEMLKKIGKKKIVFDRNGRRYPTIKHKLNAGNLKLKSLNDKKPGENNSDTNFAQNNKKKSPRGKLKVFCETMRNLGINF